MRAAMLLFLLIPLLAQAYVTWHLCALLPVPLWCKVAVGVLAAMALCMLFVAISPALDRWPMPVATVVYHVGTAWLIIMLYLFMLFMAADALRLCRVPIATYMRDSWEGTVAVVAVMTVVFAYGYIHYRHKERVPLELTTSKPLPRDLCIVMTSDWHLGYHNRRGELSRWVDLINAERPDMVLVAGDIIDRSQRPLRHEDMAAELRRIEAPVYACLGNHEYIAGEPSAELFYADAGITLLRDSVAVALVGRDDRSNPVRLPLRSLMESVPEGCYSIVLDHQPYHLEEAEQAGADFELAGHTHHGQVWPVSWITDAIYECAFGEYRRGRTRYYVSSGLGIWGGKFRIGTRSEYVVATLRSRTR